MVILNIETTGSQIVAEYGANAKDKTFLITGPSSGGLGAEALIALAASEPAQFILAGRNESKITPVIEKIREVNPDIKTSFVSLDLLDNASVRKAAEKINSNFDGIDVLINNAGIMAKKEFSLSKDGVESQFAANYLGHFLFTNLIAEKIAKVNGIVINVTSMAYALAEVNTHDANFNDGKDYSAWIAYGRSKTANILFSYALAEKYAGKFVSVATDPGMTMDTQLFANNAVDEELLAEGFRISTERQKGKDVPQTVVVSMQQGIATALLASLDPSIRDKAPAFVKECNVLEPLSYATDKGEALKLWKLSEKLVGQEFPV